MNMNYTLVTCAALGLLPLACDSGTTATTDTGAIATDGSMVGITTSNDPSAPHIIAFSTNVASISDGELVNFTAVVTDPDGIEDLIGGTLEGETGAVFGSFTTTAQEGAYSLGLSWGQINQVEPIEFAAGEGTTRVFTARFYDQSSLQTVAEVTIALACDDVLLGACDGSCIDTQESVQHCGACGFACAEIAGCCEGVCVEVGADPANCGACGNACDGDCQDGYCYQDYSGTYGDTYGGSGDYGSGGYDVEEEHPHLATPLLPARTSASLDFTSNVHDAPAPASSTWNFVRQAARGFN